MDRFNHVMRRWFIYALRGAATVSTYRDAFLWYMALFSDAAYTERYMGLPKDNLEAYQVCPLVSRFCSRRFGLPSLFQKTDVMQNVTAFKHIKYLLVHGTGDGAQFFDLIH